MNLTLQRTEYRDDGIFGVMTDDSGDEICVTLEHAYDSGAGNGSYAPKIPAGTYTCLKGQHQLASMAYPFEAFELQNVPGHTNILIHVGNYNNDSEGCILVGATTVPVGDGTQMIAMSNLTFRKFMSLQTTNEFELTIKDKQ